MHCPKILVYVVQNINCGITGVYWTEHALPKVVVYVVQNMHCPVAGTGTVIGGKSSGNVKATHDEITNNFIKNCADWSMEV